MLAQLHLAVVLAINARLLVLDEPTLGLDITFRKRFYRRLLEDYMTDDRTLLITTHQVDEIEFMLTDIMLIKDGDLLLHMPMEEVPTRFAQLVVEPAQVEAARALHPVFAETRFGQTVMVFDGADQAALAGLGNLSTPSLSDLFVALMSRDSGSEVMTAIKSWRALLVREYLEHRMSFFYFPLGIVGLLLLSGVSAFGLHRVRMAAEFPVPPGVKVFELGYLVLLALWFAYLSVTLFFYFGDSFAADRRNNAMFFWKSMPVSDLKILASKFLAGVTMFPAIVLAAGVVTGLVLYLFVNLAPFFLPGFVPPSPLQAMQSLAQRHWLRHRLLRAGAVVVCAVPRLGGGIVHGVRPLEPAACLRHPGADLGGRKHRLFRQWATRRPRLGLSQPSLAVRAQRDATGLPVRLADPVRGLDLCRAAGQEHRLDSAWSSGWCSRHWWSGSPANIVAAASPDW